MLGTGVFFFFFLSVWAQELIHQQFNSIPHTLYSSNNINTPIYIIKREKHTLGTGTESSRTRLNHVELANIAT